MKLKNFTKIELLAYPSFVYALCFPDGTPFYIGMSGRKGRPQRHFLPSSLRANSLKNQVIRQIRARGQEVLTKIFAHVNTEQEAKRVEDYLIKYYPAQLANEHACPQYRQMPYVIDGVPAARDIVEDLAEITRILINLRLWAIHHKYKNDDILEHETRLKIAHLHKHLAACIESFQDQTMLEL